MVPDPEDGIRLLFGSRVRTLILGYLAAAAAPQTGYAIARALQLGVGRVYPELRRLETIGVLTRRRDVRGAWRFQLVDEDLRRFLIRRVRVLASEVWFSPDRIAQRQRTARKAREVRIAVPPWRGRAGSRPFADEFRRPKRKDRAMRRQKRAPAEGK